ncbi:MAG TPA: hypothetical protein VEW94_06005 [Chloroflexia bacterium]|nr:hypothetical protein [Chloroflexia bacterium]
MALALLFGIGVREVQIFVAGLYLRTILDGTVPSAVPPATYTAIPSLAAVEPYMAVG